MRQAVRNILGSIRAFFGEDFHPAAIDEVELARAIGSTISWTGWAAVVPLHVGFIWIDYLTYPQHLTHFLIIRVVALAILVPIIAWARSDRLATMEAWFVIYISVTAWSIHALLITIGNAGVPYYTGLILITIGLGGERSTSRATYAINLSQIFLPFVWLGLNDGITGGFGMDLVFLGSAAGVATIGRVVMRRLQVREWAVRLRLDAEIKRANERLYATEQAAHDIRSPLSAFNILAERAAALRDDERDLARGAVARINQIANDLLAGARADRDALMAHADAGIESPAPASQSSPPTSSLPALARQLLAEKRAQYEDHGRLEFAFSANAGAEGAVTRVGAVDFQRVLSNLIDNAVEASNSCGAIRLSIEAFDRVATIAVSDDGRGIPPHVLPLLADRGRSFGKPGGSGLGLFQARRAVVAWGGQFSIASTEGRGTEVRFQVPTV